MASRIQLLFIDDEPELLEIVEDYMAVLDVEVTPVSSAEEGLEQLKKRTFDIVFADIMLPGMSGLEFVTSIRAKYPQMPIIVWSGYWNQNIRDEFNRLENMYCLDKPILRKNLEEVIASIRSRILK